MVGLPLIHIDCLIRLEHSEVPVCVDKVLNFDLSTSDFCLVLLECDLNICYIKSWNLNSNLSITDKFEFNLNF